jgi:hypothetical protein
MHVCLFQPLALLCPARSMFKSTLPPPAPTPWRRPTFAVSLQRSGSRRCPAAGRTPLGARWSTSSCCLGAWRWPCPEALGSGRWGLALVVPRGLGLATRGRLLPRGSIFPRPPGKGKRAPACLPACRPASARPPRRRAPLHAPSLRAPAPPPRHSRLATGWCLSLTWAGGRGAQGKASAAPI